MSTKEEHLWQIMRSATAGDAQPNLTFKFAEALAERDAAREEGHQSWRDGVDAAISVLRGGSTGVASKDQEKWSAERTEYLLSARRSIVTASALREERDALKRRHLAVLPGMTIDSIRALDGKDGRYVEATIGLPSDGGGTDWFELTSAKPSPAPVVGGVTMEMLDEVPSACHDEPSLRRWLNHARAAIRAQKRVDVEAIRAVADQIDNPRSDALYRAIGDAPSEASSAPQAEARKIHGIPVYVDPACPPNKLYFAAGPLRQPMDANSFAAITDIGEEPVEPSPAAPVEPVAGPFRYEPATDDKLAQITDGKTSISLTPYENESYRAENRKRYIRLLNLGHAAEQPKPPATRDMSVYTVLGHDMQDVTLSWDENGEAKSRRFVAEPATRDEQLRAICDLAVALGCEPPVGEFVVWIAPWTNHVERAMLRAHLAAKEAAK
jgi:hypothetical protein